MKTYIDIGAYNGDTVEQFYNWYKIIDDVTEYEVHAFEPNPNISGKLKEMARNHKNVHFHNKAVWIVDGTVNFAVDDSAAPLGSTLERSKIKIWDSNKHIKVKSINFSKWLERFKNYDEVVVKMDCEGTEFEILPQLIGDGTISIITLLLVEFHPNKATRYTTDDKNKLLKDLKEYTEVYEWH